MKDAGTSQLCALLAPHADFVFRLAPSWLQDACHVWIITSVLPVSLLKTKETCLKASRLVSPQVSETRQNYVAIPKPISSHGNGITMSGFMKHMEEWRRMDYLQILRFCNKTGRWSACLSSTVSVQICIAILGLKVKSCIFSHSPRKYYTNFIERN